jgi:hypothetical protein
MFGYMDNGLISQVQINTDNYKNTLFATLPPQAAE